MKKAMSAPGTIGSMIIVIIFVGILLFVILRPTNDIGKTTDDILTGMTKDACGAMYYTNKDLGDKDKDKFPDTCDNCPNCPNDDQKDEDKDGIGDKCDLHPQTKNDFNDEVLKQALLAFLSGKECGKQ